MSADAVEQFSGPIKAEFGTALLSITPTRQAVVWSLILASPASSKVGSDKSVRLSHSKFTSASGTFDLSHSHETHR